MQSYAISGDFSNAFSTLNLMKNIDGKPTVCDCNALMYFYLKSKNACWQELVEMYTGMKRFGFPLVASTFNTLLNGMLLFGDLKHAIFIVEEMYRIHFVPSFTSLSKTFKLAVKVGNLLDGLLVFELMLREGLQDNVFQWLDFVQSNGCKPNVITYTIIVKFLFDNGKFEEAMDFVSKMEREGCNPDLLTYNVILRELYHRDILDNISELIQVMDQKGLSPNSYSYAALYGGLLKIGKVGDACELLLDIFSNGTADVAVYNIYFQCLCQENKSREALSQLKRKIKARKLCNNPKDLVSYEGFQPNEVTLGILSQVVSNGSMKRFPKVAKVLDWVISNDFQKETDQKTIAG
ncbi:pentatricopeptide repeat-containing protein At1g09900 [Gossypium hirsutum]|uniref:Pentatricopeptide repeat-containing protein At1g09900 n=1 Tax=Gossypium hirsutum TaxID=3635 RepID=A0ABM2ZDJ1_GOSHI|nr:pentatricopeptide repeat-containing protein At1g09900-like [Gossypium hirsutum]